jgi:hypothetical protein
MKLLDEQAALRQNLRASLEKRGGNHLRGAADSGISPLAAQQNLGDHQ